MAKFLKQHGGSLLLSVLLHAALMGLMAVTITFSKPERPPLRIAIEATVVDPATLPDQRRQQAELQRQREIAERQERERQAAEVKRKVEAAAAEQERQEKLAEDKRKAEEVATQKAAEDKRKAEEAAKQKAAEDKRKAEEAAKRKREAEAQRKREEEVKRKAEEKAREDALRREELAREEELEVLLQGPLMAQYLREIQDRIERSWILPMSAQAGVKCELKVIQSTAGVVIDARVSVCNGDAAVVRSLEAAALRASPLPEPSDPRLFDRELIITFTR